MNEFTASNGITIVSGHGRTVRWKTVDVLHAADSFDVDSAVDKALAEWYRAREDERHGRWRYPLDRDYVVYPNADRHWVVSVVRESDGTAFYLNRDVAEQRRRTAEEAAHAYFEAHAPKRPWHEAEPNEVWVVDGIPRGVAGSKRGEPNKFIDVHARVPGVPVTDPSITDARRIFPEAE